MFGWQFEQQRNAAVLLQRFSQNLRAPNIPFPYACACLFQWLLSLLPPLVGCFLFSVAICVGSFCCSQLLLAMRLVCYVSLQMASILASIGLVLVVCTFELGI